MSLPLFSIEMLRAIEGAAAKALPPGTLMQRAGTAAARQISQRLGAAPKSVAVVCGAGNNGGDGYVCALELARRGHRVECVSLVRAATDDAKAAAAAWQEGGGATRASLDDMRPFDAVVDAMFGIGLARPLAGTFLGAAAWINRQDKSLRVALDVPSGLDADRGTWVGEVEGVTADLTITFLGAKPGLYTGVGCDATGRVLVESIGVEVPPSNLALLDPADFASLRATRARNSHKGQFGNVGVLGGGAGMVGAPLLAARAALRLGAGRVFVECIGAPQLMFDPLFPELMLRPLRGVDRLDALVAGCGLGADADARAALEWAVAAPCPVVFDADALNLLARDASLGSLLRGRAAPSIVTPHPLEAARLLNVTAAAVQEDRVQSARSLARALHATVVLKGAGTVVALPDERVWINSTGGPALATPGSGDVLGGMIGALVAQASDATEATLAAVWLHGSAADRYGGDIGLVAGEIAGRAAQCLVELRARDSV